MNPRHVTDRLAPFVDDELDPIERAQVAAHLASCTACREAHTRYQLAAQLMSALPRVSAPAHVWASIESALDRTGTRQRRGAAWWSWRPAYALAAMLLIFSAVAAGLWWGQPRQTPWDVVRLDGANRDRRMSIGEWIETGTGTARVRIGEIGTVDVAPGSRLQLLSARADEHRLNLAAGRISAVILAPPRLFFVETPVSTVVDLGCAYTMEVDQDGEGMLRVTSGWASLEWSGRESLVPAGASCPTRAAVGPGTPLFDDASPEFRRALLEFDFGAEPDAALATVLLHARDRDTLTLWHLMSRVDSRDRGRVLDRLTALTPLPAGVDRDKAMALDPDTMRMWREELAWTW